MVKRSQRRELFHKVHKLRATVKIPKDSVFLQIDSSCWAQVLQVGGLTGEGMRGEHRLCETSSQPSQPLPLLTPKKYFRLFWFFISVRKHFQFRLGRTIKEVNCTFICLLNWQIHFSHSSCGAASRTHQHSAMRLRPQTNWLSCLKCSPPYLMPKLSHLINIRKASWNYQWGWE